MSTASVFCGKQAIVIGGGIAGLLAAHILTDHFEQVTIVERDHYPAEPEFRSGTPQSRHVHTFLTRGLQILEEFFPGFKERIISRGAQPIDFVKDLRVYLPSGWLPREASHLSTITCTRSLVEWQIRQEVLRHAQVRIMEGYEVVDLLGDSNNNVRGVKLRARGQVQVGVDPHGILEGELVVDASGRDSHAPQWLTTLGYQAPKETIINAYLGYASRLYAPPPDVQHDWKGVVIQSHVPHNLRSGIIWPVEGGNWLVLMAGISKDYPPNEDEAFLDFAKGLLDPAIYEAIKDAQPLSPIYGYRRTENRRRHYEELTRLPEGFLVMGDAACALNPLYGQGMSVAVLGATVLRDLLRQQHGSLVSGLTMRFQRKLAQINATPWQFATSADSHAPIVDGARPGLVDRLITTPYIDGLFEVLSDNAFARQRFMEVVHMLRPPTALMHPSLILSVLLHRRRRPAA